MTQLVDRAVHVRIAGQSAELTLSMLNLPGSATDSQLKSAVARHLDLPEQDLAAHAVIRTSMAIIIRPEAIYG